MGDQYFFTGFPFIDISSGGNAIGMMRNVGDVLDAVQPDAKVIPGHGPLATVEDLRRYHTMMSDMIDLVSEKRSAGKSLDQIQAEGVPANYESWGQGFVGADQYLDAIYQSIH